MAATANYALPFPSSADEPNGPAQIQALAEAVDTQIVRLDGRLQLIGAVASSNLTLTSTVTDIAGTSVTFTTDNAGAVAEIEGVWDLSCNAATLAATNHVVGAFNVDGVTLGAQALLRSLPNARACVTQVYRVVLLSAGSHTFKQRGSTSASAGSQVANATHTCWTATILDGG